LTIGTWFNNILSRPVENIDGLNFERINFNYNNSQKLDNNFIAMPKGIVCAALDLLIEHPFTAKVNETFLIDISITNNSVHKFSELLLVTHQPDQLTFDRLDNNI
jgi:hypothetical protein